MLGWVVVVVVVVVALAGTGAGLAGYAFCCWEKRWLDDGAMLVSAHPTTRSTSSWRLIA